MSQISVKHGDGFLDFPMTVKLPCQAMFVFFWQSNFYFYFTSKGQTMVKSNILQDKKRERKTKKKDMPWATIEHSDINHEVEKKKRTNYKKGHHLQLECRRPK